ncbi:MAG TPA: substrate-binding domain-containing protein [Candidatus Limnocylindrales bacterium]|jgi:ribose transport system substrate-binding protein|nr:substrate-binding domain-containing protein [Candidatus Limnocylindrales bacterium]
MTITAIPKRLAALSGMLVIAAACAAPGASTAPSSGSATAAPTTAAPTTAATTAAKMYKIGYSNGGGVGNGFREEQVCTAKAEALASGQVSELTTIHRNTDAAGQLQDIRDLIAANVDAIVFNPNDPSALNPALEEAKAAGIVTVSVDQFVTNPDSYQLFNNQVKYAELGAKWLFDKLGGTGTVYYQRGFAGAGADTDRHTGFTNILKNYPNIKVLPSVDGVATQWDPATTTQVTNDFINSGDYDKIDGIWTSGMDVEAIDAIKAAGKPFHPLVGTDRGGSVTKFLDDTNYPGLDGAAVTNTAAVGGAGVALALKLLNGETVTTDPSAAQPNTVLLDPVLADDQTDAGRATLQSWLVDGLDPSWPLGLKVEGYTHYTPEQAIACKGPND